MVIRLPRPIVDDVDMVDKIVDQRSLGKNSQYFERIRKKWAQRVREYVEASGCPESIKPWPEAVKFKRDLSRYTVAHSKTQFKARIGKAS